MYKQLIMKRLLIVTCVITLNACSMAGYQHIEEMSSPRYQKGTPVMSDMKVMCRAQVIVQPKDEHPPLDFMVIYDRIWDVTIYPTSPSIPRKYPHQICKNGFSTQIITNTGIGGSSTKLETSHLKPDRYNLDPSKGAVRVWRLPRVEIDGLNYLATMVSFYPMIFEGDKLPTNGSFSRGVFTTDPHTKKEIVTINGREWQHASHQIIIGRDIPEHDGYKAGESSPVYELYTTKVGNYTFVMVATYADSLVNNVPWWLAKRQAYLRHWLESFKFEPISQIRK